MPFRSSLRLFLCATLCLHAGCILYAGPRTPDLVGRGVQVELDQAPRMEVVLRHVHTMDGKELGGQFTEATYKEFQASYERVRREFPFLAGAGVGVTDAELVLELDTRVEEQGKAGAIVSGATLLLIPGMIRSDVIVRATLKDLNGNLLASHEAIGRIRGATQILLLAALPALPFTLPGKEMYDDTFRDVFLQLGQALKSRGDAVR